MHFLNVSPVSANFQIFLGFWGTSFSCTTISEIWILKAYCNFVKNWCWSSIVQKIPSLLLIWTFCFLFFGMNYYVSYLLVWTYVLLIFCYALMCGETSAVSFLVGWEGFHVISFRCYCNKVIISQKGKRCLRQINIVTMIAISWWKCAKFKFNLVFFILRIKGQLGTTWELKSCALSLFQAVKDISWNSIFKICFLQRLHFMRLPFGFRQMLWGAALFT